MYSPILHIGYHKTATSWFQQELYPAVTNADFVPRRKVREVFLRPRPFEFDPEEARGALVTGRERRLVICEEELSGNIHVGGLHGCGTVEYARRLNATFPEAVVVLFRRELVSHVASCYRQYVKRGGTRSPDAYVFPGTHPHRRPSFSLGHFDARRLAGYYRELFGAGSVRVFELEAFARDPVDFAERYCAELDLTYDASDIRWERRPNRGYGDRLLPVARFLNLFTAKDVPDKRCLLSVPGFFRQSRRLLFHLNRLGPLGRKSGPEAVLGRELVEKIRTKAEEIGVPQSSEAR